MTFAKEAFTTVPNAVDKVRALHIDVVASYYYFSLTSEHEDQSQWWTVGKVEAQNLLRRGFEMPELQTLLAKTRVSSISSAMTSSTKAHNSFVAALAELSHEVFMLEPHSENPSQQQSLSSSVAAKCCGHPVAPAGFEQIAEDLFFKGALPFSFNLGHLLSKEIRYGELVGHRQSVKCCAVYR